MTTRCTAQEMRAALLLLADGDVLEVCGSAAFAPPAAIATDGPTPAALTLRNTGNVTILAHGASLALATPGHGLCIEDCTNVRVEGLRIAGSGKLTTPNSVYCAQILLHGRNEALTFQSCHFAQAANHGIAHLWGARSSNHCCVEGCTFESGGNYGRSDGPSPLGGDGAAIAIGGDGTRIFANRIDDWFRGIEVEPKVDPALASGVLIANNRITRCTRESILVTPTGGQANAVANLSIQGNVIVGTALDPAPFSNTGIYVSGVVGALISNNSIASIFNGVGILCRTDHALIERLSIQGNQVAGAGRAGIHVGPGASGEPCFLVSLAHNQVVSAGGVGLHLDSPSFLAHGDHIVGCAYVGMELAGAGQTLDYRLQDNQCRDAHGRTPSQYVVVGTSINARGEEA